MAEREGLLKRLGKGFDRYVGGLLGEDISTMTPEEKAAARRSIIGVIGRGMVEPGAGSTALGNVVAARAAQREQGELARRQKAAEEEMTRISARLFGGVAPTGQMIEGLEPGEAPTPVTSYYRQDPTDALRRMYGTQAGRDVAQMAPDLAKLAQEGVTGRTVGASVYNPLTGKFSQPTEQPKPKTPVREVDLGNAVIVYYSDGTSERMPKGIAPSAPGAGKPISGEFASKVVLAQGLRDAETRIAKLNPQAVTGIGATISPERMKSSDYKQYTQAAKEWAANLLYFKSGAAATPGEIESTWYQYFPVAGDGPEEIAQKNIARNQQMASVQNALKMAGVDVNLRTPYPSVSGNDDPVYKALNTGDVYIAPDGSYKRKK